MSDKSLKSILQDFWIGNCRIVNETVFASKGMLEGRMTKAMTVVLLLISLLAIFINFWVIIRIYKLLKRRTEFKPAFYFIGNLAISDFFVGLYVIVVFCIDLSNSSPIWKNKCCGFLTAAVVTACQETICTITMIAIDKYIFICHGLTYRVKVTKKRVYFVIGVSWFFSLLIGFLPALGLHEPGWCSCNFVLYVNKGFAIVLFLTAVVIPLAIIISLYSVILSLAVKMTKSRLKETRSNSSGISTTVVRLSISSKSSKSASRSTSKASNVSVISRPLVKASKASKVGMATRSTFQGATENFSSQTSSRRATKNNHSELPSTLLKINESGTLAETEAFSAVRGHTITALEDSIKSDRITSVESDAEAIKSSTQSLVERKVCLINGQEEEEENPVENLLTEQVMKQPNELVINAQEESESIETSAERHSVDSSFTQPKTRNYFKKILSETRDKVQFMQKCKAIKVIGLIVLLFIITYVPFVVGTFAYKMKNEPNERLFKALNNLLYIAVIFNSVLNPFIYAYGYQEFRVRTKRFKGLFARTSS